MRTTLKPGYAIELSKEALNKCHFEAFHCIQDKLREKSFAVKKLVDSWSYRISLSGRDDRVWLDRRLPNVSAWRFSQNLPQAHPYVQLRRRRARKPPHVVLAFAVPPIQMQQDTGHSQLLSFRCREVIRQANDSLRILVAAQPGVGGYIITEAYAAHYFRAVQEAPECSSFIVIALIPTGSA